ncbi:hypothetical protein PIB30_011515 [Stylosanthes scabra]|uniref:Uncharacterized protein n=1 Tax=Stylosanthes scabra TaxID=79078 RepID=A0ABU6T766_9FABA|nr:hypothetical protein [Stylosanthes scabra]
MAAATPATTCSATNLPENEWQRLNENGFEYTLTGDGFPTATAISDDQRHFLLTPVTRTVAEMASFIAGDVRAQGQGRSFDGDGGF